MKSRLTLPCSDELIIIPIIIVHYEGHFIVALFFTIFRNGVTMHANQLPTDYAHKKARNYLFDYSIDADGLLPSAVKGNAV